MNDITSFMTQDHRDCDDVFVNFENMIAEGINTESQWEELKEAWLLFSEKLRHHFKIEEEVLFPAFEQATGMTEGPTMVMRLDHEHMNELMAELDLAISNHNEAECQGIAETFMMMMQQHNMKEEQMLYPMTDQHTNTQDVITTMKAI